MAARTASRTVSDVLSALLSAQSGVMAGQQEARARKLQEEDLAARRKMQQDEFAAQMFGQASRFDQQSRENELEPLKFRAGLGGQTPQSMQEGINAYLGAASGQGQSPFTGQAFQDYVAGRGQLPASRPGVTARPTAPVQFVDPDAELARKETAQGFEREGAQAYPLAPELGAAFDQIKTDLLANRITEDEARARADKLRKDVVTRTQAKTKSDAEKEARVAADDQARIGLAKANAAALEAERARVEDNRKRDDVRAEEAAATAQNNTLLQRIETAKKSGNSPLLRGMLDQQAQLVKRFPQLIAPFAEDYSDTPQQVRRVTQQFNGIPNALTENETWSAETPEEVAFRRNRYLASLIENPAEKAKADKDALKDLWGVFRSERWKGLTPDVRASIIDQIGEYGSKLYGQKNLFPPGLKDIDLTPAEIESKRRWEIVNSRAQQARTDAHNSALQHLELGKKNLIAADLKERGIYGDTSAKQAIEAAKVKLQTSMRSLEDALKAPEAGFADKTTARWSEVVGEDREALNAVLANPAKAAAAIVQQQLQRPPTQRRATPAPVITHDFVQSQIDRLNTARRKSGKPPLTPAEQNNLSANLRSQ